MLDHNLEIHQRENDGVTVLDLRGKLEMGTGDVTLRDFADVLLRNGSRHLVLNMSHVSAIDTAGSNVLLFLAQQYHAAGGRLVLAHLDHAHAKIYEMARLEAVIEIYANEMDAVNSFFPDRIPPHYDILEYVESLPTHEGENDKK